MQNNYIFKDVRGNLFLYCYSNGSIIRKTFTDNKWFYEETIISDVLDNFTFNIGTNDDIYIFCQDKESNVLLLTGKQNKFTQQVVLENTSKEKCVIYFNCLINNDKLTLFFNTPKDINGKSYLYLQTMQNNIWQKATMIDSFSSFKHSYFDFLKFKNTSLLFYQNCDYKNKLGYRVMSENGFSDFVEFHNTNYEITDLSNLSINNDLFLTYIVKSSFSYQLFFRKTLKGHLSETTILTEGQNIDNVLIFYSDLLYVFFSSRDGIYFVTSQDFGENFSKPKKFKNEVDIVKAKYVTNCTSLMCVNDIYLSKNEPKKLKIIPEVYPQFYLDHKEPVIVTHNEPKQVVDNQPVREQKKVYYENLSDLNNEDFYKILLEKKKQKELAKNEQVVEKEIHSYNLDELEKLRYENEKLKKALKKFF